MTGQGHTVEEIGRRGKAIYEERIRALVEAENAGRYVTIDVETGAWELGDDILSLSEQMLARHPGAPLFTIRVGYPAASRIGFGTAAR